MSSTTMFRRLATVTPEVSYLLMLQAFAEIAADFVRQGGPEVAGELRKRLVALDNAFLEDDGPSTMALWRVPLGGALVLGLVENRMAALIATLPNSSARQRGQNALRRWCDSFPAVRHADADRLEADIAKLVTPARAAYRVEKMDGNRRQPSGQ